MSEKKIERKALGRGLRALISPSFVDLSSLEIKKESINKSLKGVDEDSNSFDKDLLKAKIDNVNLSKSGKLAHLFKSEVIEKLPSEEYNPKSDITTDIIILPISAISPNSEQPRKEFLEEELEDLVESIQTLGLLQPIIVRPHGDGFQIVAGERRWRAAQKAGLTSIPAIVKNLNNRDTLQIALVENIQRQQLTPLEEAEGYNNLINEFNMTQEEVADLVGKKRSSVTNVLRLLTLDPEVQRQVQNGKLSLGHAKVILGVKDHSAQKSLTKKVIQEGLSVRALEQILPRMLVLDRGKAVKSNAEFLVNKESGQGELSSIDYEQIVDRLREHLCTKVSIQNLSASDKGKIVIEYFSENELDRLVDKICNSSLSFS
jgi:ParB family transcriptional regulator, chromosome partitioning protein